MTTTTTTTTISVKTNDTDGCGMDLSQAELPLILLPTFILNVIAFAVLVRMKNSTESLDRLLVFSLVVNDLLATSLYIVSVFLAWVSCDRILKNHTTCALMGWLTTTMVMWSGGVITVMMSCRYLALVKPIYYRSKVTSTSVKAGLLGTLVWMALQLVFPFFNLVSPYRVYPSNKICSYELTPGVGGRFHKAMLGMISVEGLLSIALVLFFNISIIHQLRKRNQVGSESNPVYQIHQQGRQRRTAFVTVSILVSFFFCFCYGPFLGRLLYDVIINAEDQNELRHSVSLSLLFLSPLLNPVLYGVFNRRFRECLIDMMKSCFQRCRCRGTVSPEPQTLVVKTLAPPTL